MATNYTESLVAEMNAIGEFNYASATAFAEANGLKLRSVIAKAKSMGLPYTPKPVVAKNGEPITRKSELVARFEAKFEVTAPSMVKMTKGDLEVLAEALDF